jgi:hypothetical protein
MMIARGPADYEFYAGMASTVTPCLFNSLHSRYITQSYRKAKNVCLCPSEFCAKGDVSDKSSLSSKRHLGRLIQHGFERSRNWAYHNHLIAEFSYGSPC